MKKILWIAFSTLFLVLLMGKTAVSAESMSDESDYCKDRIEIYTITRVKVNSDWSVYEIETYEVTDENEIELLSSGDWEVMKSISSSDSTFSGQPENRLDYTEETYDNLFLYVYDDEEVAMFDQKVTVWRYSNNKVRIDSRVFLKRIWDTRFSNSYFNAGSIVNTDGYMSYISGDVLRVSTPIGYDDYSAIFQITMTQVSMSYS